MEKLNEYQGLSGRFHEFRDNVKERFNNFKEQHPGNIADLAKDTANTYLKGNISAEQDYSHIYRFKTQLELVRISSAVMGIEFSYAAETAFVSPTLLQIGVKHHHMTLVWAISAIIGFFLCPVLGSMSDRCKLNMGRRRPFIILLSIGVFLGLLLVPNGKDLGYLFGDTDESIAFLENNVTTNNEGNFNASLSEESSSSTTDKTKIASNNNHCWGLFFTIMGTVLLDFNADACQSPSRAYLLDICVPDDHAKGLSTFTIMAGLGGFMGYSMGGFNWDETVIGQKMGGHIKAVFAITSIIFVGCVISTVTSFREIPLWALVKSKTQKSQPANYGGMEETTFNNRETSQEEINTTLNDMDPKSNANEEGSFWNEEQQSEQYPHAVNAENVESSFSPDHVEGNPMQPQEDSIETLSHYLLSIVHMPHSLRMVCLTNLFCWMAHVCYSLYFTDFVGEAVFGGDPKGLGLAQKRYEEGVRFGCWGMAMYSLSCACYSLIIERLILRFRAKRVYVGGLLFYCVGMSLMALTRAKTSVIVFSWAAGVMYSTLFTMPYLLVAHYHAMKTFELDDNGMAAAGKSTRGLGTDVAIVSSMVFVAQFALSLCMGPIVSLSGTTTSVVTMASLLSFFGAMSATQIMYLDL